MVVVVITVTIVTIVISPLYHRHWPSVPSSLAHCAIVIGPVYHRHWPSVPGYEALFVQETGALAVSPSVREIADSSDMDEDPERALLPTVSRCPSTVRLLVVGRIGGFECCVLLCSACALPLHAPHTLLAAALCARFNHRGTLFFPSLVAAVTHPTHAYGHYHHRHH